MTKTVPAEMYDAVIAAHIPASAQVVAGYIDGDYAWGTEDWARFPDAEKVLITVTGSLTGNVADMENGDMTPAQAADWVAAKEQARHRGTTIYCQRSRVAEVWAACRGRHYYLWVADWTNVAHRVLGTIATQYAGNVNAGTLDLSRVYSQRWLDEIDRANRRWPL